MMASKMSLLISLAMDILVVHVSLFCSSFALTWPIEQFPKEQVSSVVNCSPGHSPTSKMLYANGSKTKEDGELY